MRIYVALGGGKHTIKQLTKDLAPHVLCSYEYAACLKDLAYTPKTLIIDSGAFTAWKQGRKIELHEYRAFCNKAREAYPKTQFVNLDVIPGTPGTDSTEQERAEAMRQSLDNAETLRSNGFPVIEVFHQDEPWSFMWTLIDRMPDGGILGISPRNDLTLQPRINWLRDVVGHLRTRLDPGEFPRMHILGGTAIRMMRVFPAYSMDSSTWTIPTQYGRYITAQGTQKDIDETLPHSRGNAPIRWGIHRTLKNYKRFTRQMRNLWRRRGVKHAAPTFV